MIAVPHERSYDAIHCLSSVSPLTETLWRGGAAEPMPSCHSPITHDGRVALRLAMRSGTIELPSGRWHWTLIPQWGGSTVIYQHGSRLHDEMRNWTSDSALTIEQAIEFGRDPLERKWTDVDGLRWRLSIELPSHWRRKGRGIAFRGEGTLWLVFNRGGLKKAVDVSPDTHLGDLEHLELRDLLDRAFGTGAMKGS